MALKLKLISIEGNIATGKSTHFDYIKTLNLPNVFFVDEPVKEWLEIKDKDNKNALECFYSDQKKNSFCFQVLAYITRLKKVIDMIKLHPNGIIISERCIETDRNVFAKMLYEADNISSIEWETYNYWYNCFAEISQVDLIIYIKTDPNECKQRILKRNRLEESNIPLDYLEQCHEKHELWLNSTDKPVICINGNDSIDIIRTNIDNIFIDIMKN
jgi:deoxyadenosine/deoxycytidine kinase